MPASNTHNNSQWRDSWPPAQLHLPLQQHAQHAQHDTHSTTYSHHKEEDRHMQLADDDNPLAYFLTPMTPPLLAADDDDDDNNDNSDNNDNENYSYGYGFGYSTGMDFDFDAGIEDDAHPLPDIRSVSPSVLAENILSGGTAGRRGLPLPSTVVRPPTPPKASARHDLQSEEEEDQDQDMPDADGHFETFGYTFGQTIPIKIANTNHNRRGKTVTRKGKVSSMRGLSASSSSSVSDENSNYTLSSAAFIPRRRSPRSWRVPSPDVFMIEEEPEAEAEDDDAFGELSRSQAPTPASDALPTPSDYGTSFLAAAAAKPATKRVRFVLP